MILTFTEDNRDNINYLFVCACIDGVYVRAMSYRRAIEHEQHRNDKMKKKPNRILR